MIFGDEGQKVGIPSPMQAPMREELLNRLRNITPYDRPSRCERRTCEAIWARGDTFFEFENRLFYLRIGRYCNEKSILIIRNRGPLAIKEVFIGATWALFKEERIKRNCLSLD